MQYIAGHMQNIAGSSNSVDRCFFLWYNIVTANKRLQKGHPEGRRAMPRRCPDADMITLSNIHL